MTKPQKSRRAANAKAAGQAEPPETASSQSASISSASGLSGQIDGGVLSLVRMMQFGDSTLPIGAFAFSNALESAIQKGIVRDAQDLQDYTACAIEQAATGDAVGLAWAMRYAAQEAWDDLVMVDHEVHCRRLPEESRLMSVRMGKKLVEMCLSTTELPGLDIWLGRINAHETPGTYPVSLGLLFSRMGLPVQQALVVHQYGLAATILNAALRLMRVTHLDTQRILFRLMENLDRQCAVASSAPLERMSTYAPMSEILGAVHVKAHVRMFMN
ncbi:MAG: urease accessory protein UreF [Desulfovibrio sp.]|nr:urease accessory protein UreF [Desulfovibrio sp.]